jgi:hypothetical protein
VNRSLICIHVLATIVRGDEVVAMDAETTLVG